MHNTHGSAFQPGEPPKPLPDNTRWWASRSHNEEPHYVNRLSIQTQHRLFWSLTEVCVQIYLQLRMSSQASCSQPTCKLVMQNGWLKTSRLFLPQACTYYFNPLAVMTRSHRPHTIKATFKRLYFYKESDIILYIFWPIKKKLLWELALSLSVHVHMWSGTYVWGRSWMWRSEYKLSYQSSGAVHIVLRQGLSLASNLLSRPG